ncbi:MAG: glycosyltransferase family 4 protein [Pirellulaceae bacterium]
MLDSSPHRILHISATDNLGGSGRSAYKIHSGLKRLGFDSKMIVRWKATTDADVMPIRTGAWKLADKLASTAMDALGLQYLYLPSSRRLLRQPWYRAADVVQLYNTHGNYFSHSVLPRMSLDKPIVWRLSDMWPMTGHCAYPGECTKWKTGCERCPALDLFPRLKRDTTRFLWQHKQRLYSQCRLHLVAPSQWILDQARQSPLLSQFPVSIIHNGIDGQTFRPQARDDCRQRLHLAWTGPAILFLADDVRDRRKGGNLFLEAVRRLWNTGTRDFLVMLVGAHAAEWDVDLPCPVWRQDAIRDDAKLSAVYGAADALVHAAPQENLPNSVLEAMACGRPAVAFVAGGVAEVVKHLRTGYLAPVGDTAALADGMAWILSDERRWQTLADNCRRLVSREFSLAGQAEGFARLYRQLLQDAPQQAAA